MSEKKVESSKKRARRSITRSPKKFKIANDALVHMFDRTVGLLEHTLNSGKLNPAQGLLGMMMVADLLHGGAYTAPSSERPYLVGNASKYYAKTGIGTTDFYPVPGINILDLVGSYFGIEGALAENKVGMAITTEIYANANVPHVFPKLLSDEAYAKIAVMCEFLSHTKVVQEAALGIKTFVEASVLPVQALSEAAQHVMPSAEQLKQLTPLLSLLEV